MKKGEVYEGIIEQAVTRQRAGIRLVPEMT